MGCKTVLDSLRGGTKTATMQGQKDQKNQNTGSTSLGRKGVQHAVIKGYKGKETATILKERKNFHQKLSGVNVEIKLKKKHLIWKSLVKLGGGVAGKGENHSPGGKPFFVLPKNREKTGGMPKKTSTPSEIRIENLGHVVGKWGVGLEHNQGGVKHNGC